MPKIPRPTFLKVCLSLLALGFLVLLTACGGTTTPPPTTTATAVPTSTPTTAPTNTPAPAATPTASSSANSVSIANFAFSPPTLTISVGTKVTWTNNDTATHTVTADQGAFDSGQLSPGASFSFTFTKAGSYSYHCNIHHSMTATVVVQ